MTLPAATATWYGPGSYEPNTDYDQDAAWMWPTADNVPGEENRKVYFNAWSSIYATNVHYNSATAGSRVREFPLFYAQGLLGAWKDCNNDGYIGTVETAAMVYPAATLTDTSICPAKPGEALVHNDGEWVYEFLHVGPGFGDIAPGVLNSSIDTTVERDAPGAFVWGDYGRPGGVPGTSCPVAPLPHGTSAGTGAFIRWADCLAGFRITSTVNAADPDGSLGLGFKCDGMSDADCQKNPQKSTSLLNQELPESLFGNPRTHETGTLQKDPENDGEHAFTTWDCSAKKGGADVHDDFAGASDGQREAAAVAREGQEVGVSQVVVRDPTGGSLAAAFGADNTVTVNLTDEEGSYVYLARVAPDANDPRWSVAGGLNDTFNGYGVGAADTAENCDDGNTYNGAHATAFFYADGDFEGTAQAPGKNKASITMSFDDDGFFGLAGSNAVSRALRQGACPPSQVGGDCIGGFGDRTPTNLGVTPGMWLIGRSWSSGVISLTTPQSIDDDTLQPVPAIYITFYAYIDDVIVQRHALTMPPVGTQTYGSYNCDVIGPDAAIQNGWVCDPAGWYVDAEGASEIEPNDRLPGDPFNLRDVDCWDGRAHRDYPVYTSLAPLSAAGTCADAAK